MANRRIYKLRVNDIWQSLRKSLAKETIDLFSKFENGISNIGSISKKFLSKLVRLTKS
jgi:hypothetical protein